MRSFTTPSILVLLALALPIAGCHCGRGKPPSSPQQRVDELLARGHSPLLGPREPLDEIKRDLPTYRETLRRELTLPTDLRELLGKRQQRLVRTLAILSYVDTADSAELVVEMMRSNVEYMRKVWAQPPREGKPPPVEGMMFEVFVEGLETLKARPEFVEDAFTLLDTTPVPEPTARLNVIKYLARVAENDPTVVTRMRTLLNSKNSPVRDDPMLRKYVEHLEKPDATPPVR